MRYAFEDFELDPERRELTRGSEAIAVGPQVFDLLLCLVANHDRVVSKDDLLDTVWSGRIVSESTLSSHVSAVRKAICDSGDEQRLLRTVARKGFRFVGEVRRAAPLDGDADITTPPLDVGPNLALADGPLLAVLPFLNLSGDPEQEYFADGVVGDIITACSRFKSFAVIARNSSFAYKGRSVGVRQLAKELGVRYVLEGSVQRAGARLRITAQLSDCETGAQRWARSFDGAEDDIFEMQDRITESVVGVVAPQIREAEIERSRRKRPETLDAYDLVLRSMHILRTYYAEGSAEAFRLCMEAVRRQPDYGFALGYAVYTLQACIQLGWPPITTNDREIGLKLARRALLHSNGDGETMVRAGIMLVVAQEYEAGMRTVGAAVDTSPNNVLTCSVAAAANLHCGDLHDCLALFHRAIRLSPADPLQQLAFAGVAHAHMALGEYADALEWAHRAVAASAGYTPAYWMLVSANAKLGRMDEARRWLAKFRAVDPKATIASIRNGAPNRYSDRMAAIIEGLRLAGMPEGGPG